MRTPYRIGSSIYLRPMNVEEDAPLFLDWFNDPEVTRFTRRYLPMTLVQRGKRVYPPSHGVNNTTPEKLAQPSLRRDEP
jgi:hypothetical protein